MKNRPAKKMLIAAVIILLLLLQGCGQQPNAKTQPANPKAATGQKTDGAQLVPAVPRIDPAKVAESDKFLTEGLKYYEVYEYRKAVTAFDNAIAANPENYKVYTAKGIALCFAEDYQAGMALIQKTLAMKPDYVPAFYDMAMAYKLQHRYDESLYWFQKTIQGDPQNTWSYYGISTIYADRGDTQESLRYLKKAIALDPAVKAVANEQDHFAKMHSLPEFQALVR